MATLDYEAKTLEYDTLDKLVGLWEKIEKGHTRSLGFDKGKALEFLVLRAFLREGAAVRWPYTVSSVNEQIDGAIHTETISYLVECKDYADSINVEPLAKLRNQLLRRPAHTAGIVFSRNGFTDPAKTLAQYMAPQLILLWHGEEFSYALKKERLMEGLLLKYRTCIEEGIPDYYLDAVTMP